MKYLVTLDKYFLLLLFMWPKHILIICIEFWKSCMGKLESSLYGVCIETSVITLTTLSVLAITGELLIGLKIIQEPPSDKNTRYVNEISTQTTVTSQNGETYDPGGDNLSPNIFIANCVFRYTSLVISALFFLEICLKILVRGRSFFVFPWQIFDLLVVLGVFGIEITFLFVILPQPYWEAMTYVVILRYWRIPSICNIRANARLIEFNQELESWRAAKQKVDEKCRNLQYELDKIKLEDMGTNNMNGHIPGKSKEETGKKPREDNIINTEKVKVTNGIIKSSQQNGHNAHIIVDETDSKLSNNIEKVESAKIVKSVNFDMSFDTEISTSPSPSPKRQNDDNAKSSYKRTDSESSISYQATEEEVVVQIENAIQSELDNTEDATCLISDTHIESEDYSYVNGSFDEVDDLVLRKDLQVMADIDGTKTYRSADGIPMTSL